MAKRKTDDDWEYVEVKANTSKQTKAQKEFQEEAERKGKKYNLKHIDTFDLFE